MTTTDEIMAMIISYGSTCMAYADGLEDATDLDNAKDPIKSAIEALVREVEYTHQHTLIECPQCGFTGAREYEPKEST
jgi:hypothetical protein